ncbi:MAG: GntR family transcriptional regulator [Acetobacteraceae bacterium]
MSVDTPQLKLGPLDMSGGLRRLATDALKRAITEMDIYGHLGEIRLDERQLSQDLGVSRTPIREALGFLEQEGLVRSVPRRGVFVVRKTKAEILDMIMVWAAIEGMAARLATRRATDDELHQLRTLFEAFEVDPSAHLHEYSQANMEFHRAIIRMSGCALMSELTDSLFIHMRAVRAVTMGWDDRAKRSLADHLDIIAALEARDADRAEHLVRQHTFGLAAHIEAHGGLLDAGPA